MLKDGKVFVIPCSGIGKALGTVGRAAMYEVVEKLRPNEATTVCLPLLTIRDEAVLKLARNNSCISVDGCPFQCARKNIESSKGKLVASFVVTDVLRENRGLKPEGVTELGPKGLKLASILAEKIAGRIDEINNNR
ncbi:MAG: putative zinc-binding protein [Candidatus Bathyarchaeota archaeon]|nr:putative zinc-binding protein [Candidatus Bathyarchaeota archaeon]MDH5733011.1 putative zinc-binding protein [Candidatus Bathyarchaeota archaeon]